MCCQPVMICRHRGDSALGRQQSIKIGFVPMTVDDVYSILLDELSDRKNQFEIQWTPACENSTVNPMALGFLQNLFVGVVDISYDTENRLTTIRSF